MGTASISHLPYRLPPDGGRFYFYENYWKRVALKLLHKHAGNLKGWTLLDYGCGRGETMDLATRRGMIASGTDLDPECVARSSGFGPTYLLNPDDRSGSLERRVSMPSPASMSLSTFQLRGKH